MSRLLRRSLPRPTEVFLLISNFLLSVNLVLASLTDSISPTLLYSSYINISSYIKLHYLTCADKLIKVLYTIVNG